MKVITNVLLLMALLLAFDTPSFADSVILKAVVFKPAGGGLPRTGSATSDITGDDGYYHAGYPKYPADQFTDNKNNTVTDNGTGLTWIKDQTVPGLQNIVFKYGQGPNLGFGSPCSYGDGFSLVAALNALNSGAGYGGHNIWRMPNVIELLSIMDYYNTISNGRPIACSIFKRSQDFCWTSTHSGGVVWIVSMGVLNGLLIQGGTTYSAIVSPVCGGQTG